MLPCHMQVGCMDRFKMETETELEADSEQISQVKVHPSDTYLTAIWHPSDTELTPS